MHSHVLQQQIKSTREQVEKETTEQDRTEETFLRDSLDDSTDFTALRESSKRNI